MDLHSKADQDIEMEQRQETPTPLAIPIPDAYWVIPGRLLAGPYPRPRGKSGARRRLRHFLDEGRIWRISEVNDVRMVARKDQVLSETQTAAAKPDH